MHRGNRKPHNKYEELSKALKERLKKPELNTEIWKGWWYENYHLNQRIKRKWKVAEAVEKQELGYQGV